MANQTLEEYVDDLLDERGLSLVDEAVLVELRADLLSRIQERLHAEMVALLNDDAREELEDLLDIGTAPHAIRDWLAQHVSNFSDVYVQTLADFRTSYLK